MCPQDAWTPRIQRVHICPEQDVKLLTWPAVCVTQVVEDELEVSAPPDVVGGEQSSPSSLGLLED